MVEVSVAYNLARGWRLELEVPLCAGPVPTSWLTCVTTLLELTGGKTSVPQFPPLLSWLS